MLVLDSFRGHITDCVKEIIANEACDLVIIPGGKTSIVQPLDVVLNKPFKDCVRAFYNERMAQEDNPKTPTVQLQQVGILAVPAFPDEDDLAAKRPSLDRQTHCQVLLLLGMR
ncbi:putative POGO family transposase [Ixodes scapularis]